MKLERVILEALELVHPRMLRQATLMGDVRMQLPETTQAELTLALRRLERKEEPQVIMIGGDDGTRIKISPAGLARLAE